MGASSSEPKALKNAVDRVKPGLSVLDQTRSDEAFFKVYYRHWPRLQIDGWTVRLQQHFQKSANGVHELINALLSVAGPSGGQDYIDGLITRAMGADRSNRSKPQNWQWLWSEVDKMKQRPGHRWWIRRDLAGSSSFEAAVEAALGDRPQHFRKIAKTTGLDTIQVRNRLAVLHRRERAFPHGNGLWARTKRDTPQSSLSDKIWMALDGGREANYIELADELHERQTSICSCLSRMKDGVKGKKVVKTPDGKYKRSALG